MARLILVDDDVNVLGGFTKILEHAGFEVTPFSSPLEAKSTLIQVDAPDVHCFILDLDMPEMTGVEFYESLPPLYHKIPVIYISGVVDSYESYLSEHPEETCLTKPFSYQELVEAIQKKIDHAKNI